MIAVVRCAKISCCSKISVQMYKLLYSKVNINEKNPHFIRNLKLIFILYYKFGLIFATKTMQFRVFFFLIMSTFLLACSTSKKTTNTPLKPQVTEHFPESWAGNWVGSLDIHTAKSKSQTVRMEVEIKKIDTSSNRYIFALIYGEDKIKGRRAYEMIVKDPSKGLYVNDEKNTIQMEEYFINNKLYCWFEVEGSLLLSIFEKKGDELLFDIISGSSTPISTTGGQQHEGEAIPPVKTFPIKVVQNAVLKKAK
jgi:hypothetical protein